MHDIYLWLVWREETGKKKDLSQIICWGDFFKPAYFFQTQQSSFHGFVSGLIRNLPQLLSHRAHRGERRLLAFPEKQDNLFFCLLWENGMTEHLTLWYPELWIELVLSFDICVPELSLFERWQSECQQLWKKMSCQNGCPKLMKSGQTVDWMPLSV